MATKKFLHERITEEFGNQRIRDTEMPTSISNNLSPRFKIRRYQREAFARFLLYMDKYTTKEEPTHLLFNMATGSGKTLIMAGLILYLYEMGYRNFLFFVNLKNIIEKTKDNFLNPRSSKYLFNNQIHLDDRQVEIVQTESFHGISERSINICFTTIKGLHDNLESVKENRPTYEDFAQQKTVLLADEAHHLNARTKSKVDRERNWENTVGRVFNSHRANLLLEFTATHDYEKPAMIHKYLDKVIYCYDLRSFRKEGFSKEIVLIESALDLQQRILQAVVLSYYKRRVASNHGIHLKPVILFKAQKTIEQSRQTQQDFRTLIDNLTGAMIASLKKSEIKTVQRAFRFFDKENISLYQLAQRLKSEFREQNCLSVNDENEKDNYQVKLNTLEDRNNPIQAIFAVQKLNEGWDVLNLFDIVRCYETKPKEDKKITKTTISEAQLIGRGARYFPFTTKDNDDKFRRKFDGDVIPHELRVLEELHYHSIKDQRYIAELKEALTEEGLMDKDVVECDLKLKPDFKKTSFYQKGVIWLNNRRERDYRSIRSLKDIGIDMDNEYAYEYSVASGHGREVPIMKTGKLSALRNEEAQMILVSEIPKSIMMAAIARNPFFKFISIKRYFPHLSSMYEFISNDSYLGGLKILFHGNDELDLRDKLNACIGLLGKVEKDIRSKHTNHEGTREFDRKEKVKLIFKDKQLKIRKDRLKDDSSIDSIVANESWYAFDADYGTSEEQAFVEMMSTWIKTSQHKYQEIYLLRNEKHFKIFNFYNGKPFQPDFVLHIKKKNGKTINYQLFIEPKGEHLMEHDKWKEKFLEEIGRKGEIVGETEAYRLIGLPFFNRKRRKKFSDALDQSLREL